MPKFSLEKIVKADIEKVFDVVTDIESLQKTMPHRFPSVRILSTRDNVSVAEEHLLIAEKELVMMTKHVIDRPRTHEVYVIGGNAKGSHIVEEYSVVRQGTKIVVNADLKLSGILKIAGFLGKAKIKDDFAEMMDEFAVLAEC